MIDRRVHAECKDYELVRYERSGHWYVESKRYGVGRVQLNIRQAAEKAVEASKQRGGRIHFDLPGGSTFDRNVRRLLA